MTEESLFAEALKRTDSAERAAYLDAACSGDAALRARLDELLRAHDGAADFLEALAAPDATGAYTPAPDAAPASYEGPGDWLGPYRLLQKLGEGGMGAVWLAEQEQPVRRRVALKVIKAGMDSAHVLARFEQERQALALMDHPNIAKVLDAGATPAGRPYFVMELVKGVAITKYCDQVRLTPRERLELMLPVCEAVQHAHQKGVIHRDLKPSNVLVALYDGRPVPKVIDFGVAKATAQKLAERTLFTEVGQIVGTLEYMAPEQAELNNLDVDTRADIYSLGVLLYELLTGSPPFTARQLRSAAFTEMLRIIREQEPPRPSTRLSNSEELPALAAKRKLEPRRLTRLVTGELDWVVMKCLEKERARRYESASALGQDMRRYLADEPVAAGPPSAAYRLRKFVRRHRGSVLAATLVALALVAGLLGTSVALAWALDAEQLAGDRLEEARIADAAKTTALTELRAANKATTKALGKVRAANAETTRALIDLGRAKQTAEQALKDAEKDREKAVQARGAAERALAEAAAVNKFVLNDLLQQASAEGQANAGSAIDPDVKLRVVLDRAAARVEGRFKDQPLVEASVQFTLGNTYRGLGLYAAAEKHLKRAVALRRRTLGDDDIETLTALNDLGTACNYQSKLAEAETLFEEVRSRRGRYVGLPRKIFPTATLNLAHVAHRRGQYARAEALLREVIKDNCAIAGENHETTLTAKNNLAMAYMEQRRFAEAEKLLDESLTISRRFLGPRHPITLTTLQNFASLNYLQQRIVRAEEIFRDVLSTLQEIHGKSHPALVTVLINLALLELDLGRLTQAEERARQAVAMARNYFAADHPTMLEAENALASALHARGKDSEARPLLEHFLKGCRRLYGPDHKHTLDTERRLLTVYRALEVRERAGPDVVQALEPLLLRVLASARKRDMPHNLFWALVSVGDNKLKLGKYAEAEVLLRECLRLTSDHKLQAWQRAFAQALLGRSLAGQKKYAEAEPLLRQGFEGLRRTTPLPILAVFCESATIHCLADLHETAGRHDEARSWRAKPLRRPLRAGNDPNRGIDNRDAPRREIER